MTAFDRIGPHWRRTVGEAVRGAEKGLASLGRCSFLRMAALNPPGMLL